MMKHGWKRIQPTSLRHALELCKDYAREHRNLSVERIADRMGVADHWTVYKWINSGRIPANMIRAYETVCGINYATRWLAASDGGLLIEIPTGRKIIAEDIQVLQGALNDAVGKLLQFAADKANAVDTLAGIQLAMEGLAWHHGNVEKYVQPELELGNAS